MPRRFLRAHVLLLVLVAGLTLVLETRAADKVTEIHDLPYKTGTDLTVYEQERCKLDLYLPEKKSGFATLVWIHGGGLTQQTKQSEFTLDVCRSLAGGGIAVAAINYRLSPKVNYPAYVQDTASAIAWVRANIALHGGAVGKIYVGGHSAGGYLAMMVALDEQYLKAVGLESKDIAGWIPVSGQAMTHYTIRVERGLPKMRAIADEAAPVYHARKDTAPWLVIMGDKDMAMRMEENIYFVSVMKAAGHKSVKQLIVPDRTHGTLAGEIANAGDPARLAILEFMK